MAHVLPGRTQINVLLFCSLPLLFITATPFAAAAETVQELETGLRNCQANWDRLNERIKQVCPYEAVTQEVCLQYFDNLEADKRYRSLIESRPDPQGIAAKRKECDKARENYLGCSITWDSHRTDCSQYRKWEERCRQELQAMLKGDMIDTQQKQAELTRLNAAIAKDQQDYELCLRQLQWADECLRLKGQLTSVVAACDDIKTRLQAARAAAAGQTVQTTQPNASPTGTVRIFPTGPVPNEVGGQMTYQARVESDSQATKGTRYAYYWYVNGQNNNRGYDLTAFSFAAPQKGVNSVGVLVMRTSDSGRTWQKVGEAIDRIYVEWDARDAAGATGRPGSAPAAGTPAPQPQSTPAPPAGSSSQYDKYLKPMSCERACQTGCSASRDPQCLNQCLLKCK